MRSGLCSKCEVALTSVNCAPSTLRRGGGYCRSCFNSWDRRRIRDNARQVREYRRTTIGRYSRLKKVLIEECIGSDDLLWSVNFYTELIKDNLCHYCSMSLSPCGHGLDRMDNSLGHVCFNVVPCCGHCNRIKGDFWTYEHMMDLSPKIKEIKGIGMHS